MAAAITIKVSVAILGVEKVDEMCPDCSTWAIERVHVALSYSDRLEMSTRTYCHGCHGRARG